MMKRTASSGRVPVLAGEDSNVVTVEPQASGVRVSYASWYQELR